MASSHLHQPAHSDARSSPGQRVVKPRLDAPDDANVPAIQRVPEELWQMIVDEVLSDFDIKPYGKVFQRNKSKLQAVTSLALVSPKFRDRVLRGVGKRQLVYFEDLKSLGRSLQHREPRGYHPHIRRSKIQFYNIGDWGEALDIEGAKETGILRRKAFTLDSRQRLEFQESLSRIKVDVIAFRVLSMDYHAEGDWASQGVTLQKLRRERKRWFPVQLSQNAEVFLQVEFRDGTSDWAELLTVPGELLVVRSTN